MTSQQSGILGVTPTLDTLSVWFFPQDRSGTERVKLCKQWLLHLLKGASFDSSPSVEIHFWHDMHGVVAVAALHLLHCLL